MRRPPVARRSSREKMTVAKSAALRDGVDRLMVEKVAASRPQLGDKMISMARDHGLSVVDLFGNGRKGDPQGSMAPKNRDPASGGAWAGRGRMPRRMPAATKGGKAKQQDFLI